MFRNLNSTQEMLFDSQRTSCSGDSALLCSSQIQQSQPEFSQVRSQDLFTQKLSGSQNEGLLTSNKKMTMYEKWMNRGTLLKRDPVAERKEGNKSLPAFLTEQQQYNIFQNRAKERDEKDLLQQVVSIVQESTKEVKSTLDAVKFKLDSSTEFSGDKFNATLKSFLEDICKHEDRMLHAVEEQRCILTRVHDLEHELAVKTAELKHLQSQQQTQDREEDAKRLARTVCQELHSPNLTVKNKLEEILEVAHETSKQQCQQLNQYKKQMTNQGKQYVESKNANQRLIKDMEKRLLKEITNFCSTVQQQEQKWQSSLQELLAEAAMSQKQDIKQFLEKLCSSDRKGDSKQRAAADTQVLTQTIRKEIQLLLTKQAKTVEKCVQDLLKHQLYDQGQQLKNLQAALVTDMTLSVEAAARHFSSDLVMPLSLPKFEKKMEEHHADLKHQLEELHHRHLQEVLRIQNELKSQCMATSTLNSFSLSNSHICAGRQPLPTHTTSQKCSEESTGIYPYMAKGTARISPLSKSDQATLFCKAKPSPVVAVLPQKQVDRIPTPFTSGAHIVHKAQTLPFSDGIEEISNANLKNAAIEKKQKKRKKSSSSKKKSRSKKKCQETPVSNKPALSAVSHKVSKNKRKLTAARRIPNNGLTLATDISSLMLKSQRPKNQQNSPSKASSTISSPSVSLTEVVVVRRSRWHTKSTVQKQPSIGFGGDDITDILSTPWLQNKE